MALALRADAKSPGVHQVMHGEREVGRIDKRPSFIGPEGRWIWHLNGVPGGPKGIRLTGVTETIDEAEADLKKSWEQWLEWASLSDVRARF
jgi:hypothetical protein